MTLTPRAYSMSNPEGIYFVSFSVVFWIDVFIWRRYKEIFVESLKFCIANKGLRVHAWCLMSSHVHLIISASQPEKVKLSDILRDLKKFTSSQLIREIETSNESRKEWLLNKFTFAASKNNPNNTYQFWQQNNHAEELISNKFMDQKLHYIHQNPVQEGWVDEGHHYLYSSARDYAGLPGLVPVELLD